MKLNVKDKMEEKGINRYQLAKSAHIGYPAANAIYKGETTRIGLETLESLCRVLECTPNDILITDDPQIKRLLEYSYKYKKIQKQNKNGTDS